MHAIFPVLILHILLVSEEILKFDQYIEKNYLIFSKWWRDLVIVLHHDVTIICWGNAEIKFINFLTLTVFNIFELALWNW